MTVRRLTHPLKRYAAALLIGAMALALLTPAYLIHVKPGSAIYHRKLFVFASQVIPYVVRVVTTAAVVAISFAAFIVRWWYKKVPHA